MRRALAIFVALLVLVPLGALLFLRSAPGRRWLAREVERVAQKQLAGKLHIGALDGRLPRTLVLHDLTLDDVEGREAIAVRELTLEPDWRSLITRHIVIRSLEGRGVSVHARRLADGRLNLAALAIPSTQASTRSFEIASAGADGAAEWQELRVGAHADGRLQFGAGGTHLLMQAALTPPAGNAFARFSLDGDDWSATLRAVAVELPLQRPRILARFSQLSAQASAHGAAAQIVVDGDGEVSEIGEQPARFSLATHGGIDWSAAGPPRAKLTLDHLQVAQGDLRVRSLTPARIELGPVLAIENLRLASGDARLTLSLRVPIPFHTTRPIALRVEGRAPSLQKLASLSWLQKLASPRLPPPSLLDGSLRFTLVAHGTARAPRLSLTLAADDLSLRSTALGRLAAQLDYRGARLVVHARATTGAAGSVRLDAALPIALDLAALLAHRPWLRRPTTAPLAAELHLDGLALAALPLAPFGLHTPVRAGLFSGTLALDGTSADPRLHGELSVRGLATNPVGKLHAQRDLDAVLRLTWAGGRARGALEADSAGAPLLVAHATATLRPSTLAGWRDAPFSLDVVVPDLALGHGDLSAQLALTGSFRHPRGKLTAGANAVDVAGMTLSHARLEGDSDGKQLSARFTTDLASGGKLAAHGTLALSGLTPSALQLEATLQKVPLAEGPIGAWVDADLTLRGRRADDGRGFTGTLTLARGTLHLPKLSTTRRLQSTAPQKDVVFVDARASQTAAGLPIEGTLDTHIDGPIHVRGPELSTDLDGQLTVHVDGKQTRVAGHIHAAGGWVDLLGRRFHIKRLQLGFDGGADIDPTLDIRLTRDVSDVVIAIEASGTASHPELSFTSNPPVYTQSQILGIVVSGDPGNTRVSDRALDQQLVGALSTVVVGQLKEQVLPALPIDVVKMDTGENGYTGLTTTRMEVGKYLTERIYASYVHQFGVLQLGTHRLNANEADVEWRFRRHFSLTTRFGDAGAGALDLFWTLRY